MNIETVLAQLGNRSEALTGTVSAPFICPQPTGIKE
jgi:hypothetical protein